MSEPFRLHAGVAAPDFTLPDQHGRPVTLSSFRGRRVILYFYGEALSPACTRQAGDFRDRLGVFRAAGYEIIGVSRDPQEKQARFADKEQLTFPILADDRLVASNLYGAFGEKQMYGRTVTGVIRSTFVIDESGVIEQALYNIKATGHVAMLGTRLGLRV